MNSKYEEGVWYGWNGGECPVHPKTIVEAQHEHRETYDARSFEWHHDNEYPIIAFRVVKEHREPREWWVYETWDHKIQPCDRHTTGAFKVREVIEE